MLISHWRLLRWRRSCWLRTDLLTLGVCRGLQCVNLFSLLFQLLVMFMILKLLLLPLSSSYVSEEMEINCTSCCLRGLSGRAFQRFEVCCAGTAGGNRWQTHLVCEMEMKHVPVHVSVCVLDCMSYNLLWYPLEKSEYRIILTRLRVILSAFNNYRSHRALTMCWWPRLLGCVIIYILVSVQSGCQRKLEMGDWKT